MRLNPFELKFFYATKTARVILQLFRKTLNIFKILFIITYSEKKKIPPVYVSLKWTSVAEMSIH